MCQCISVRVISRKILRDYCQSHADACEALYEKIDGKMTPTINQEDYARLLVKYLPKIIETEEENEQAIALSTELEHKANRTQEEEAILELLVTLIEKFEEEHYPIPEGKPHSILLHLMEAGGVKQEDLVGVIGSRGVVSEVINGKRSISKAQAKTLAEFFKVDVSLFI